MQIVRPPTHARDQNPIELAALPPHYLPPRFRALALFERRPHARVEGPVIAGVRKPAQKLTYGLRSSLRQLASMIDEKPRCWIRMRDLIVISPGHYEHAWFPAPGKAMNVIVAGSNNTNPPIG